MDEVARVLSVVLFTAGTAWLINAIRHMTQGTSEPTEQEQR